MWNKKETTNGSIQLRESDEEWPDCFVAGATEWKPLFHVF